MPAGNVELQGYWTLDAKDIDIKYESENTAMGTVAPAKETVNDVKGTAIGSTATPKAGYELVGWYDKADTSKKIISTKAKLVPEKDSAKKKYLPKTYVDKFKEKADITIKYESEDANKGTVAPAKESLQPATCSAKGSTPTAKPGYEFEGWYDKATNKKVDSSWVGAGNKLTPQKSGGVYEAKTYVAKFKEKAAVTIMYKAGEGGKVSNASDTVNPEIGNPKSSAATADKGYTFVGWYNDDTGEKVNDAWVSADNKLVPQKINGVHKPYTYMAHFRKNATLTPDKELKINKYLGGANYTDKSKKETFTFKLVPLNGAPMPAKDTITITTDELRTSQGFTVTKGFGSIEYTQPGEYKYEVMEIAGTDTVHWDYATNKATFKVTVIEDANDDKLIVSKTEGKDATFENLYVTESSEGNFIPSVNKVVNGPVVSGQEKDFTFKLQGEGNAPMPAKAEAKVHGNGSVNFGKIKYVKAGEYTYSVKEVKGSDKGYTYSNDEYKVVVKVEDNNGKLTVTDVKTTLNGKKADAITFTNKYMPLEAKTSDPSIEKKITGDKTSRDEQFKFILTADKSANPMPEGASNGAKTYMITGKGKAKLGTWNYTKTGTYTYKLKEVNGKAKGYKYDETIYTITDKVTDENGQLKVTRVVKDQNGKDVDASKLVFQNKYTAPPKPTPNTGDASNLGLFGGLFSISGGALAILLTLRRRKLRENN